PVADLAVQPLPVGVQLVEQAREPLLQEVDLLEPQVQRGEYPPEQRHALCPDDLDAALGVAELADVGEETPVLAGEAGEVEVLEDVAQQYEPLELGGPEEKEEVGRQRDAG